MLPANGRDDHLFILNHFFFYVQITKVFDRKDKKAESQSHPFIT